MTRARARDVTRATRRKQVKAAAPATEQGRSGATSDAGGRKNACAGWEAGPGFKVTLNEIPGRPLGSGLSLGLISYTLAMISGPPQSLALGPPNFTDLFPKV